MFQNQPKILSLLGQFLPIILIAIIFYFFLIRPQNKQRALLEEMINNLKSGDKIITRGGIIGTVNQVNQDSFIIELYDGSKIEVLKSAIASIFDDKERTK